MQISEDRRTEMTKDTSVDFHILLTFGKYDDKDSDDSSNNGLHGEVMENTFHQRFCHHLNNPGWRSWEIFNIVSFVKSLSVYGYFFDSFCLAEQK